MLYDAILLGTQCLLDPAVSRGRRTASVETLFQHLPPEDAPLRRRLRADLRALRAECADLKAWRHRRVAHRDYATALEDHAQPLEIVRANSMDAPMPASDTAVLTAIEGDILRPDVITAALQQALAKLRPSAEAALARRTDLEARLATVTRELDRLTTAIVTTGPVPALLDAVKDREAQRETLTRELGGLQAAGQQIDWTKVETTCGRSWPTGRGCCGGTWRRPGRS